MMLGILLDLSVGVTDRQANEFDKTGIWISAGSSFDCRMDMKEHLMFILCMLKQLINVPAIVQLKMNPS